MTHFNKSFIQNKLLIRYDLDAGINMRSNPDWKVPKKEDNLFDLGGLYSDIMNFDDEKANKQQQIHTDYKSNKGGNDTVGDELKNANTDCYSPSGIRRGQNALNGDTGEKTTQILGTASSQNKNNL